MLNIKFCVAAAVFAGVIAGGCSDEQKKIEHKSTYTETISGLSADTVLIEVNGRKATKSELEKVRSFRQAFYRLMQKDVKESDLEKVDKTALGTFAGNFIRETLFQDAINAYLKENGPFTSNQLAVARKKVQQMYSASNANAPMRFSAIRKQLKNSGVLDYFDRMIELETLQEAFFENAFTNRFVIDSNTVARVYASVAEHNAIVAETNKVIEAKMKEVLGKLDAGTPFELLADEYSMDDKKMPGGDLGECVEQDFAEDPEVWKVVSKLAVGGHTDVVDAGDSYQIFKLVAKVPAAESQAREDSLRLARIYFRRAVPVDQYTDEQVRSTLEKDRRKRLTTEIIEKGLMDIKVDFPNGDLLPRDSADFYLDRAKELKEEAAAKTGTPKEG